MDCPSCGQANPADATFCGACGHALTAAPPCPSCGRPSPSALRFCRGCGARLTDTSAALSTTIGPLRQAEPNPLDRLAGGVFVGREREMDELRAGLEEVLSGRGRLLMLVGEPGIGKTRTANELATYAGLRGAQVLAGRCYEGEGAPPYWPWIQAIRAYVYDRDVATLLSEMGPGAADIAQVVAEVQERLPDLPIPPALETEQARFRLFDSITTFFKNAGKGQPLVLILDDLHWADKPSLLLLQFLARELKGARLLVLGTYRGVEVGRRHPLAQTLAELVREEVCQRLPLRGLSEWDVTRFIELTAGLQPPAALVTAIYRQTEGNPFFVNEIVRLLVTDGRLERPEEVASWGLAIPQGVREVISHRLDRLSEACNRVLTIASVIGREFALHVLERVSDLDGARLLDVLEEAMTARVIQEVPRAVGRYSFAHALICETLYGELTSTRRVRLHRQIGAVLEQVYGANPKPHLGELAYHFFQAAPAGDVAKAIDYTIRAGKSATILLAYEEAANHYEMALQALELKEPNEGQRCELLLALGDAQRRAGEVQKARETFLRAADIARTLGTPEHLAGAAWGFGGEWDESGILDERLVGLLEEALRALGEGDSALRVRVLGRLARALYFSDAVERRAWLSQQAVQMARRVGDTAALAYALGARRYALWGPENVEERLAIATEIVRLAEKAGDKEIALEGHYWRLTDLLELGDIAGVDSEIQAYAELAAELRQPLFQSRTSLRQAMRALLEGRFEEGEQLARQALALGQRAQNQTTGLLFGVQMFTLRWEQGRLQEMEGAIKGFSERYAAIPAWRCALAFLHSELGREAEVRAEFERLAANDCADLPRDANWLIGVILLSQVCAYLGDARRAATLYGLLRPYAGRNVVVGRAAAACLGSASRYLGLLAATVTRWEEAAQHFEDALAMNAKLGARPWLAHTQHEYANMLLACGQPDDREKALALLNRARDSARELGMKSLIEKVEPRSSALAATSTRPDDRYPPRAPVKRQPSLEGNLFRKEGDYWTIAYEGRVLRVKDAKGLHYIAHLLRCPWSEVHVADLVAAMETRHAGSAAHTDGGISEAQLARHGLRVCGPGDAGAVLDARAKAAYKRRLDDLREELEEAQGCNDPARAAKAQGEIDFIAKELAAAYGLGGRARRGADTKEKIRKAVTNRIRASLAKMQPEHPSLWRHLFKAIKMGTFCSYAPEKPTAWEL